MNERNITIIPTLTANCMKLLYIICDQTIYDERTIYHNRTKLTMITCSLNNEHYTINNIYI